MSLQNELELKKAIVLLSHEALLNVYYTTSCIKKTAAGFFRPFGLTDVQFNLMMLLARQVEANSGLSQAQLSDMMLVNRANITSLIDRMEKAGFVVRTATDDRRFNIIKLTAHGKKLLAKVEPLYAEQIKKTMACLSKPEQKKLISMLEKIRQRLAE